MAGAMLRGLRTRNNANIGTVRVLRPAKHSKFDRMAEVATHIPAHACADIFIFPQEPVSQYIGEDSWQAAWIPASADCIRPKPSCALEIRPRTSKRLMARLKVQLRITKL